MSDRLVFGVDSAPPAKPHHKNLLLDAHPDGNPCVKVFGEGPKDTTCAGCDHLKAIKYSKRYYKCDLRPLTGGPASDHRLRWPACSEYTARKEGEDIETFHPSH